MAAPMAVGLSSGAGIGGFTATGGLTTGGSKHMSTT